MMSGLAKKDQSLYMAMIGDIRRSREVADRQGVQSRLEEQLVRINRERGRGLASSFVITIGDEFQGLLRRPQAAMEIVASLDAALERIDVRYGFGWGSLATRLRKKSIGMDGPCFHAAREALNWAKQEDRWVAVRGFGDEDDLILNDILGLMGAVRRRWKRSQVETVAYMRGAGTQKEVALSRGVAESTVSKALKGALHEQMMDAERAVTTILARHARVAKPGSEPRRGRGQ